MKVKNNTLDILNAIKMWDEAIEIDLDELDQMFDIYYFV